MPSEKKAKKLPPVLTRTYEATKKGWKTFGQDANVLHRAKFELVAVSPLGEKSFGAVWRTTIEEVEYSSDPLGAGADDDFPLDDNKWIALD